MLCPYEEQGEQPNDVFSLGMGCRLTSISGEGVSTCIPCIAGQWAEVAWPRCRNCGSGTSPQEEHVGFYIQHCFCIGTFTSVAVMTQADCIPVLPGYYGINALRCTEIQL
jgi:hypothetical protein